MSSSNAKTIFVIDQNREIVRDSIAQFIDEKIIGREEFIQLFCLCNDYACDLRAKHNAKGSAERFEVALSLCLLRGAAEILGELLATDSEASIDG